MNGKRQVLTSADDVTSYGELLSRLTLSDDRATPVSSHSSHARTSAIVTAVVTAGRRHTYTVRRVYVTFDLQGIGPISTLSSTSSVNPPDAVRTVI